MQSKTYVQSEDDQLIHIGCNTSPISVSSSLHDRPGPSLGTQPTVALTAVHYSFCHKVQALAWAVYLDPRTLGEKCWQNILK